MQSTDQNKTDKNQTRQQLKELSAALKFKVDAGIYPNINAAIVASYKNIEHDEFKLFMQWEQKGFSIVKGAKGFPVWAPPVTGKKKEAEIKEGAESEGYQYFPICYLFSNAQVRRNENV